MDTDQIAGILMLPFAFIIFTVLALNLYELKKNIYIKKHEPEVMKKLLENRTIELIEDGTPKICVNERCRDNKVLLKAGEHWRGNFFEIKFPRYVGKNKDEIVFYPGDIAISEAIYNDALTSKPEIINDFRWQRYTSTEGKNFYYMNNRFENEKECKKFIDWLYAKNDPTATCSSEARKHLQNTEPPKILSAMDTVAAYLYTYGMKIAIALLIIVLAFGMITGGFVKDPYDSNDTYSKWEYINKFDTPLAPLDK